MFCIFHVSVTIYKIVSTLHVCVTVYIRYFCIFNVSMAAFMNYHMRFYKLIVLTYVSS